MTVQQSRQNRNSHLLLYRHVDPPLHPWLKLAGRWIERAGFEAGQRVRVNVEHGRLTITAE
nr:SymE family type I addiction module toxin [Caballeronia sp. ATUFL_M2_KS44]